MTEYLVHWLSIYGARQALLVRAYSVVEARAKAQAELMENFESFRRILSIEENL